MELRDLLDRAMEESGRSPRILISDREGQFTSNAIAEWTTDNDVDHRFGAVGKKGSIAVIERFFLTLKNECTRRLHVALRELSFRRELMAYVSWYNEHRPHSGLDGQSPNDVYFDRSASKSRPSGAIVIEAFDKRRNLPIVRVAA